jgi:hypothetical protein
MKQCFSRNALDDIPRVFDANAAVFCPLGMSSCCVPKMLGVVLNVSEGLMLGSIR